jgi:hypothetical protein
MGCASSTQQHQAITVNPRDLQSIPVNKSQPYRHGGPVTMVKIIICLGKNNVSIL